MGEAHKKRTLRGVTANLPLRPAGVRKWLEKYIFARRDEHFDGERDHPVVNFGSLLAFSIKCRAGH
jgi:hypothetical protein